MTELFHYNGIEKVPRDAINVVIESNVVAIGERAFYDCDSISNVTIPPSVTAIKRSAFSGCTSLSTIIIPISVKIIERSAFYGCTSLAAITLPTSITTIKWGAFYFCTSLSAITIPTSITTLEARAFYGCNSLQTIILPPSVTTINWGAFCGCKSLSNITIPPSVKTIKGYTFSACTSLSTIIITPSVTAIEGYAFYGCTSLSTIVIPPSIAHIEYNTFFNCPRLTSIEVHSLPSIVIKNTNRINFHAIINTKIGELRNVFDENSFCLISKDTYKMLGIGFEKEYNRLRDEDDIFVNWRIYSQKRNEQGRLPLFTASEQNMKWSKGLSELLEGYGAAIEETDVITGLEAFMLAAIGTTSNFETVFKLLQDHPAAINPYIIVTQ